jgi:hypothetical protein
MNLFKPVVLSRQQIESLRKIQSKGRKHFVLHWGNLRWGASLFIGTTLWYWHDKFGWHIPAPSPVVFFDFSFRLVLWTIAGYIWGAYMWKKWQGKITPQD